MDMKHYHTRERAATAIRVPLRDPATGAPTEDWIEVRSSLSDQFIEARDASLQAAPRIGALPPEEKKEAIKEQQLKLKSSLVAGWSFEEECNEDNVVEFLRNAPQVQSVVVNVADSNVSFFGEPSKSS